MSADTKFCQPLFHRLLGKILKILQSRCYLNLVIRHGTWLWPQWHAYQTSQQVRPDSQITSEITKKMLFWKEAAPSFKKSDQRLSQRRLNRLLAKRGWSPDCLYVYILDTVETLKIYGNCLYMNEYEMAPYYNAAWAHRILSGFLQIVWARSRECGT